MLRVLGVVALLAVVGAAAFGDGLVTQNLSPVAVYVLFWVGLTIVCSLVFDVGNAGLDPLATLGRLVAPATARPYPSGAWPAAAGLLVFRPSPCGSGCSARWPRSGDPGTGRIRAGAPVVGLARVTPTTGLLASVAVVAALYLVAMRVAASMTGRTRTELARLFVHSLVPIAVAYAVTRYFSLLVLEGQAAIALVSDPRGAGWDLFGTADRSIDYTLVSPNEIAYVQVAAIVAGHVAGVVRAHGRALARLPKAVATRSQYPLLAAMVAFTVGGLGLLLGG